MAPTILVCGNGKETQREHLAPYKTTAKYQQQKSLPGTHESQICTKPTSVLLVISTIALDINDKIDMLSGN
jgi:hypothetical protein